MNNRCALPGWDNDTFEVQSVEHQNFINKYIPAPDKTGLLYKYNPCKIRDFDSGGNFTLVSCEKWVYSKEYFGDSMITKVDFYLKNVSKI